MTEEQLYHEQQEYNLYQMLINTKQYLTMEEYELCKKWNAEEAKDVLFYIGSYSKLGAYLNLNVYSEYEHEKQQYEMETGVHGSFDNL